MNENSLEFADQLYSVGDVYLMIREFKRAADALKECMSIREKKAPDDWWTGVVALQLGNSLRKLEQFEAAEKLLLQAWQISEQIRIRLIGTPDRRRRDWLAFTTS